MVSEEEDYEMRKKQLCHQLDYRMSQLKEVTADMDRLFDEFDKLTGHKTYWRKEESVKV